jgi:hypothetical protein
MNKEQVMGIVRHALTFIGGIFVIKGIATEAMTDEVIGAVVTAVGAIWSFIKNGSSASKSTA